MKTSPKLLLAWAAATLVVSGVAQAQNSPSSGYSMYAPGSAYVGLNVGQANYRLDNGVGGFAADQRKKAYSIYGGGYFSNNFGVELSYTDFDRINRAGGTTYANGFGASLVGKLPVAPSFNLLAKVGTLYGRTDVSSDPASGITPGKEAKWGMSYGVGAEYAFSPNWSGVLQYDEYRMKFAGTGIGKVNTTSIGMRYNF